MAVEQLNNETEVRTIEDLVNSLTREQLTMLERILWLPKESPLHFHLKSVLYHRVQLLRGASV